MPAYRQAAAPSVPLSEGIEIVSLIIDEESLTRNVGSPTLSDTIEVLDIITKKTP
jgi:hypothetical protein